MKKISTAYILLFAGIISLCIFSFLFYKRIKLLMYSYEMVNRSTQVSFQTDKFFLSLRDATVHYRDYLRLHDQNSLNAFKVKITEYPQIIGYLKQLENGNINQQKNLQQVNVLAQHYVSYMQKLIALDKIKPPTNDMLDSGRGMLNTIRTDVNNITNIESEVMKTRDNELNRHIYTTPLFLLIFSLTSIAIITGAFLTIIRQTKKNKSITVKRNKIQDADKAGAGCYNYL